jgi:hypothetical protein
MSAGSSSHSGARFAFNAAFRDVDFAELAPPLIPHNHIATAFT